ncbi:Membrane transport protein MMPL domain-containing protein [Smaragdicoccus niigatensis]
MFELWGGLVYRARYLVIGTMVTILLALGSYGLTLNDHLSQSGWDDPGSNSVAAARLADETYGRDHNSDVIALYTAPDGKTVDDPEFAAKIVDNLEKAVREHPTEIMRINASYWKIPGALSNTQLADADRKHAFVSIAINGSNDTESTRNFKAVSDVFYINGIDVELAGLLPVAHGLNDTMAEDIHRMEVLAIPAVGILLFFVFGGIVAASLPLAIGALAVLGAWGIVRIITHFTEVNSFVSPVVSLLGLGMAIDYALIMVSRFREEIASGRGTQDAVRRTIVTAGRTVIFSATMIIASIGGLLIFPQGFLKSVAYGAIATVALAAITALTILPAILSVLGKKVDALSFKRLRKTKTAEEVESGIWGRMTLSVMRHPLKITVPIVVGLLLLIMPVSGIKFGGINEKYLPPTNPTRIAQQQFDELFPLRPTQPIKLVVVTESPSQIGPIKSEASHAPGLREKFKSDLSVVTKNNVFVMNGTLDGKTDVKETIDYLRNMAVPEGVKVYVGGTPALERDSITALLKLLPLMLVVVAALTTILMFLSFGSLVLPIKAVLMSALGLGSTLGILTWIFVDGHGSHLLNFTPGPIMSPVLVLIIAIIFGLSTDYEVFLLSRMVEARALGAPTAEAVRVGTANTSRIVSAAALILIVVTGAFGFSQLVMMKYIAFGMIAALVIDATLLRMFLVPAVMKMLGDDCWWAPQWMKRMQSRIGLGEPIPEEDRIPHDAPELQVSSSV